ncbi:MAG: hypothetical protein BGO11_13670 [Solirubrobacterales bacterium 70-9]|nr:MAG: hypothetical protein BGO11_13670 [Solirubrobacterales bacterium 70-9]
MLSPVATLPPVSSSTIPLPGSLTSRFPSGVTAIIRAPSGRAQTLAVQPFGTSSWCGEERVPPSSPGGTESVTSARPSDAAVEVPALEVSVEVPPALPPPPVDSLAPLDVVAPASLEVAALDEPPPDPHPAIASSARAMAASAATMPARGRRLTRPVSRIRPPGSEQAMSPRPRAAFAVPRPMYGELRTRRRALVRALTEAAWG